MGKAGTEVAKEAASIILLDDNFNSIVAAVMWGRNIYDSIRKFLQLQLKVNLVAAVCILVGAAVLRQAVLSVVQLLWINLIMDTLAALALATEAPSESLLQRKPYGKSDNMISKTMIKHIIGQAIYQIAVVIILVFAADYFIPEYLTPNDSLPASAIYSSNGNGQQYMRSGRFYYVTVDSNNDYKDLFDQYGPSRHFTMVFNTFVTMIIFNFFSCRRLYDEVNIFQGVGKNKMFIGIVGIVSALQIIWGNFGGIVFTVSLHGMDVRQWLIAVAFGFGTLIVNFLLKIPTLRRKPEPTNIDKNSTSYRQVEIKFE